MPRRKGQRNTRPSKTPRRQGTSIRWPWDFRGRDACTPDSISDDIAKLRKWVSFSLVLNSLVRL